MEKFPSARRLTIQISVGYIYFDEHLPAAQIIRFYHYFRLLVWLMDLRRVFFHKVTTFYSKYSTYSLSFALAKVIQFHLLYDFNKETGLSLERIVPVFSNRSPRYDEREKERNFSLFSRGRVSSSPRLLRFSAEIA